MQYFKDELREELLATQGAKASDKSIIVRCPYCGDSRRSKDHGHLLLY